MAIKYNKFNCTNRIYKIFVKNIKTWAIFEKNLNQVVESLKIVKKNLHKFWENFTKI